MPPMAIRFPAAFLGDTGALRSAGLTTAFLEGRVPAFTIDGDELFTFENRAITPMMI